MKTARLRRPAQDQDEDRQRALNLIPGRLQWTTRKHVPVPQMECLPTGRGLVPPKKFAEMMARMMELDS